MVHGRPVQAAQNHSRTALSHQEPKTDLSARLGSGSGSLRLISAQSRTGGNTTYDTANSPLCNHIEKWYKELYLKLVNKYRWTNQLSSSKEEALWLTAAASSSIVCTPFSPDGAIDKIVQFIVTSDQVCINFSFEPNKT